MKSLLNSMSSEVRIRLTDLLVIKMLNCLGLIPDSFSAEAVDAFTQDWSSLAIVGKVLAPTMRSSLVRGTLVVPMSKSAYFWPLLSTNGFHLNSFIADWMNLPSRPDLFVKGRTKNSLFSTDPLQVKVSCSTHWFCCYEWPWFICGVLHIFKGPLLRV